MTRIASKLLLQRPYYTITVNPIANTQIMFDDMMVTGGTTQTFTVNNAVQIKFKANTTGFDNTSLVINGSRYSTSSGTTERTVNITFNANATMITERWNNATTGK